MCVQNTSRWTVRGASVWRRRDSKYKCEISRFFAWCIERTSRHIFVPRYEHERARAWNRIHVSFVNNERECPLLFPWLFHLGIITITTETSQAYERMGEYFTNSLDVVSRQSIRPRDLLLACPRSLATILLYRPLTLADDSR